METMLDYIGLTPEKIAKLEATDVDDLAKAALLITHGVRRGILTAEEAVTQLHNIIVAMCAEED